MSEPIKLDHLGRILMPGGEIIEVNERPLTFYTVQPGSFPGILEQMQYVAGLLSDPNVSTFKPVYTLAETLKTYREKDGISDPEAAMIEEGLQWAIHAKGSPFNSVEDLIHGLETIETQPEQRRNETAEFLRNNLYRVSFGFTGKGPLKKEFQESPS